MTRIGLGLLLFMTACASATACQTPANLPTPTVTAKGTAGDEDIPDLTIRQVSLKAGETLLVSCNDEGGDAEVSWGETSLHRDAAAHGSGFYTMIFTLYSANGGAADIVASH